MPGGGRYGVGIMCVWTAAMYALHVLILTLRSPTQHFTRRKDVDPAGADKVEAALKLEARNQVRLSGRAPWRGVLAFAFACAPPY